MLGRPPIRVIALLILATPVVIGTFRLNRPRPMRPLVYLLLYFALAPIVMLAVWAIQEGWIGEVCTLPTLPVVVGGIATPSAACTLDLMLQRRISVQVRCREERSWPDDSEIFREVVPAVHPAPPWVGLVCTCKWANQALCVG